MKDADMVASWRVLVIDDNPDDRELVLRELRKEFPSVEAEQIIDARGLEAALERREFDLVITDFQLRWTTGIAVLDAVKKRCPDCPVIMFTGTGSEEIAVEAMKSGLDDYIVKKPSHFFRVRAAAKSVLNQAWTRRRTVELETRLDSVLSRFHLGVFRCTTEGRRLESNDVFLTMLGLSPPAKTATSEELSQLLDPLLQLDACRELLDRVLKTGVSQDCELQWQRPDETVIWIRLSVSLAITSAGETVVDGIAEDITERKELEQLLHKRADAGGRLSLLSPREYEVMSLSSSKLTTSSFIECKWFPVEGFCLGIFAAAEQVFGGMLQHQGQSRQAEPFQS